MARHDDCFCPVREKATPALFRLGPAAMREIARAPSPGGIALSAGSGDTLVRVFDVLLAQRTAATAGAPGGRRSGPPPGLPIREATRQFARAARASGRRHMRQTQRVLCPGRR